MSLLKPPNNEHLDNKVIRYDPKKFRGAKKIQDLVPKNRNLKLAVILIALSGFLLLIEVTELHSYIFSALNLEDYRSEIKNQSKVSASGEVVKKASDEAEAKLRPCTKLNEPKVSDEDIAQYLRQSNLLLNKVSTFETRIVNVETKAARVAIYNEIVYEAQNLTKFFNERLVRCYFNHEDPVRVAKRADTVAKALQGLKERL